MMRKLILLLVVLVGACDPYVPTPNTPEPSGGPGECQEACKNMQDAKCEEGDPTPRKGKPCVVWCANYHEPGYMPPWSGCVAAAGPDPEKIEACNMKCTRTE